MILAKDGEIWTQVAEDLASEHNRVTEGNECFTAGFLAMSVRISSSCVSNDLMNDTTARLFAQ